ncbi:MAG: insulinase family protein [Alphaproteobacteria bacterium]|nr:insulinase family protein [Alphaproteobacteria bacterium]
MGKFFSILTAAFFAVAPLAAQADVLHGQEQVFNIAVENTSLYSISLWVPFGSIADSKPGIAHVLEHLKFKTSDGKGFDAFNAVAGSNANAQTDYQSTRYDLNVPPDGLEEALRSLAKIITPLKITDADLATEKAIVKQELFQRTQADPDTPFYLDFYSRLFKGLPFERYPGATPTEIDNVTMKDVLDFDAAHYQNSSFLLQISGPYLNNSQMAVLKTLFPKAAYGQLLVNAQMRTKHLDADLMALPPLVPALPTPKVEPSKFAMQKKSDRVRSPKLTWSKIVTAPTPWRAVVASSVLGDAMRSRLAEGLHDKIADDAGLVQNWDVRVRRVSEDLWQIQFSASLQPGVKPEDVQSILESYLAGLAKSGLSNASFERLKKRKFLLSEWENVDGRIRSLGEDMTDFGLKKASGFRQELESLTVDDVNQLMVALQQPGRLGFALLTPQGGAQ